MADTLQLGKNAQLWIVAGEVDPATPPNDGSEVQFDCIENATIARSKTEIECKLRKGNGTTLYAAGLQDSSIEGNYVKVPGDQGYDIINTAYEQDSLITVWAYCGPRNEATSSGVGFVGQVFQLEENQEVDDKIGGTFSIKPSACSTFAPIRIVGDPALTV